MGCAASKPQNAEAPREPARDVNYILKLKSATLDAARLSTDEGIATEASTIEAGDEKKSVGNESAEVVATTAREIMEQILAECVVEKGVEQEVEEEKEGYFGYLTAIFQAAVASQDQEDTIFGFLYETIDAKNVFVEPQETMFGFLLEVLEEDMVFLTAPSEDNFNALEEDNVSVKKLDVASFTSADETDASSGTTTSHSMGIQVGLSNIVKFLPLHEPTPLMKEVKSPPRANKVLVGPTPFGFGFNGRKSTPPRVKYTPPKLKRVDGCEASVSDGSSIGSATKSGSVRYMSVTSKPLPEAVKNQVVHDDDNVSVITMDTCLSKKMVINDCRSPMSEIRSSPLRALAGRSATERIASRSPNRMSLIQRQSVLNKSPARTRRSSLEDIEGLKENASNASTVNVHQNKSTSGLKKGGINKPTSDVNKILSTPKDRHLRTPPNARA